jgi:hypothetical protein
VKFYHLIFSPNSSLLAFQRGVQEALKKMNFQQRNTEEAKQQEATVTLVGKAKLQNQVIFVLYFYFT